MKHHPDRNDDNDSSKNFFQRINQAYEIVGNAENRANYDKYGASYFELDENDFLTNSLVPRAAAAPLDYWFDASYVIGFSERTALSKDAIQKVISLILKQPPAPETSPYVMLTSPGASGFQIQIHRDFDPSFHKSVLYLSWELKDITEEAKIDVALSLARLGWSNVEQGRTDEYCWIRAEKSANLKEWWQQDAAEFLFTSINLRLKSSEKHPDEYQLDCEIGGLEDQFYIDPPEDPYPWGYSGCFLFLPSILLIPVGLLELCAYIFDWWPHTFMETYFPIWGWIAFPIYTLSGIITSKSDFKTGIFYLVIGIFLGYVFLPSELTAHVEPLAPIFLVVCSLYLMGITIFEYFFEDDYDWFIALIYLAWTIGFCSMALISLELIPSFS